MVKTTRDADLKVPHVARWRRDVLWEAIGVGGQDLVGHAFISYAREDSPRVDRLQRLLREAGIPVWRDTSDLWPGEDWRMKIRHAIARDALVFIACFSCDSLTRAKGFQNEELTLAIEQLRLRQLGLPWLIPVRFDDCEVPDFALGGGRTLSDIQRVDLFGDRFDENVGRIVTVIRQALRQPPGGRTSGEPDDYHRGLPLAGHGGLPAPMRERLVRVAPRPDTLAGREGLLAELHARLARGEHDGPQVVALHGMGGTGKTSVAVEYAHQNMDATAVTWQFPAAEPVVLAAEFGRLAAMLGIAGSAGEPQDPVVTVHAWLAASTSSWLLIFDDAPGRQGVRQFLPPAGNGRVLITSQSALWPHGQGLEVPVLDGESAAGLLISRTESKDRPTAAVLASELGGLPLALEQAAAYVAACGASLAEYLSLFRGHREEMLRRGEAADYDKTVATTWSLAFTRLEHQSPPAITLMRLLACYAPEPVPLKLLLRPPGPPGIDPVIARHVLPMLADPLAVTDAVAELRKYSLISLADAGQVVVHRLVQVVTIGQMPIEIARGWRQAAAEIIEAAIPGDAVGPGSWPVFAALLPHAQAVLGAQSNGMGQIANYLGFSGNYATARDLSEQVLRARGSALGAEHPLTLSARSSLAYWTGKAGNAAGARDQCAALLPLIERILGAEHPNTLTCRTDLAQWTGTAGDAAGARDQLTQALQLIERALGSDHPNVLIDRAHLASWTGTAGDTVAARDQYADLLPITQRTLGPDHPDTLTNRANLAAWTGEAGDPAKARDLYAALVPDRERILGPEHPDTLSTRANLARWTGRAGDPAGACEQYRGLLPVRERVSGPEHPLTLIDRANYASMTGQAGDAAGERDLYAALLPVAEQILGSEHPDTLTARSNLASATGRAGDTAQARDQFAALLPTYERVLGPEHPDTLTTQGHLASWTAYAGNLRNARDQYASLLPIAERVLGEEHPNTQVVRKNLADCERRINLTPAHKISDTPIMGAPC